MISKFLRGLAILAAVATVKAGEVTGPVTRGSGQGNGKALISALVRDDRTVIELLSDAKTINYQDPDTRETPLGIASILFLESSVKLFCERGADVNLPGPIGRTPIFRASPPLIPYLIEQGADPTVYDAFGLHPLYVAVLAGRIERVKALLEVGAPIDQKTKSEKTALWPAVERRDLRMVRLLLNEGAYVLSRTGDSSLLNVPTSFSILKLLKERAESVLVERAATADSEEAPECSICLLPIGKNAGVITACGHQFHMSGCYTALRYPKTCPLCRLKNPKLIKRKAITAKVKERKEDKQLARAGAARKKRCGKRAAKSKAELLTAKIFQDAAESDSEFFEDSDPEAEESWSPKSESSW